MKNLFLSIILTSACIIGYGQVKKPVKVEKVSSTPSLDRGQRPPSQLEREMPSKERGQKPSSQLEREIPSKERGQKPSSQLEREMPSKERGQRPPSQLEREMPSKERGQRPPSQLEREMPSKERGQRLPSQLEREMPSKGNPMSVKPSSENVSNNAFCNGWRDGYIKEWNAKSVEVVTPKVPPCEQNPNLEGYKNGYKAGMKRAQLDKL